MHISEEQLAAFRSLEEAMWISETRGDPEWFDAALAPHFTEHGASGSVWDRETIKTIPISAHIPVELPFPNFVVRPLEPTVMLITYTVAVNGNTSNRSSIWRHNGERWLMEFHQGTRVPQPDPEQSVSLPSTTESSLDPAGLRTATFGKQLRGYDPEAVDGFLEKLALQIEAGTAVTAQQIASERFELALRGYACDEVDTLLASLQARVN